MVTNPDPFKKSDKTAYALVVSGRRITAATFNNLRDQLVPLPDGLLADASQTFGLRRDAE
jgi:hypothetical protein